MAESYLLRTIRFLDEDHLETFCDTLFSIAEDHYVDLDEFEKTFKSLCLQLPLESEWFEKKRQLL